MIRFLQTPTRTKKYVLGGLLIVICFMMVITLIPGIGISDFGGTSRGTLATVGGQEVLTAEVQTAARNLSRRQFPQGAPEMMQTYFLQNAANNLIMQKTLEVESRRMGLSVSDAELREFLQHGQFGDLFFPGGNYVGQDQYADLISQNFQMSVQQFEQAVKSQLLIDKLQGTVVSGVSVSEDDLKQQFRKQNAKVKVQYAVLTLNDVKSKINPTDAELKAFYDQGKARYENSIPEKRKAKYVSLDSGSAFQRLKASVKPEQLQQYYDQHQEEFKTPEEVKASHILIRTPPPGPDGKPDQKGVQAAKTKAEDILKKLRAGGDFAEIAKKESQDPGSAAKGGDLGWFRRGAMVPEFDKAAYSQPVGKIGDLVQTSFGFHIIKVEDKHAAGLRPFNEVKEEIATKTVQQEAVKQAQDEANSVLQEAQKQGLDKAAADHHLQVTTSDWFGRVDTLPGIGNAPEFMNAAFTAKPKDAPQLVKTSTGAAAGGIPVEHYAVMQVTDVQAPRTPSFDEIKSKVTDDFKNFRAQQLVAQKTQELADRAHAEHDLKKAAAEVGATVKTSDMVDATGQVPDLGAMQQGPAAVAFDLKQGEISGALNLGSNGGVLQVVEKQEPSESDFAKDKDRIREQLLRQKEQERMQMYVFGLRERMQKDGKIKINQDEWSRVVGANVPTS
jgi:peptidyl-prolyl cis-trans isomerase D